MKTYIPTTYNDKYDRIERNNKYGIIDRNGKIIVEPVFDGIFIGVDFVRFYLSGYGSALWPIDKINEL